MKDLDNIIEAVSYVLKVPTEQIAKGKADKLREQLSRNFVCHIIVNVFPLLAAPYANMAGLKYSDVIRLATEAQGSIDGSYGVRKAMSAIRAGLGLPRLPGDASAPAISDTKRLFGFDYTDAEERMMERAKEAAKARMDAICSYGIKPNSMLVRPSFSRAV